MRLVKDACPILRARRYIKAGRIWRALRPLLGNGLILAEGDAGGRCGAGAAGALATAAARPATEAGPDALATAGDRGQVGLTSFAQICRHSS